jgi:UDP-2,3-diacylglucosamine hydrolase
MAGMDIDHAMLISDLHLEKDRPQMTSIFHHFLKGKAKEVPALFLLGDIYEVWVGDDDDDPFVSKIGLAIADYVRDGHQVYYMHGNRDFLLGEQYAASAGFALLPDPFQLMLGKVPTILTHGDAQCTTETAYQAFRAQARTPQWQASILALPLDQRRALARHMRNESIEGQRARYDNGQGYADVTEEGVQALFQDNNAARLIHGHTHRPATHRHSLPDGRVIERIVLSDWHDDHGEALEVRPDASVVRHHLT